MGGRDHSCPDCGHGGFNNDLECICPELDALRAKMDAASLIFFAYGQAAADHYLETGETPAMNRKAGPDA